MKIEHFALNVPDPLAMARWYVANLGLTVKRRLVEEPYTHFLTDDSGTVMLEIYRQEVPKLDFPNTHAMSCHIAFVSHEVNRDVDRIVAAGGKLEGNITSFPSGDCYAMVRDPWGVTLQFVSRSQPMV